jgi:hypothetical protein
MININFSILLLISLFGPNVLLTTLLPLGERRVSRWVVGAKGVTSKSYVRKYYRPEKKTTF